MLRRAPATIMNTSREHGSANPLSSPHAPLERRHRSAVLAARRCWRTRRTRSAHHCDAPTGFETIRQRAWPSARDDSDPSPQAIVGAQRRRAEVSNGGESDCVARMWRRGGQSRWRSVVQYKGKQVARKGRREGDASRRSRRWEGRPRRQRQRREGLVVLALLRDRLVCGSSQPSQSTHRVSRREAAKNAQTTTPTTRPTDETRRVRRSCAHDERPADRQCTGLLREPERECTHEVLPPVQPQHGPPPELLLPDRRAHAAHERFLVRSSPRRTPSTSTTAAAVPRRTRRHPRQEPLLDVLVVVPRVLGVLAVVRKRVHERRRARVARVCARELRPLPRRVSCVCGRSAEERRQGECSSAPSERRPPRRAAERAPSPGSRARRAPRSSGPAAKNRTPRRAVRCGNSAHLGEPTRKEDEANSRTSKSRTLACAPTNAVLTTCSTSFSPHPSAAAFSARTLSSSLLLALSRASTSSHAAARTSRSVRRASDCAVRRPSRRVESSAGRAATVPWAARASRRESRCEVVERAVGSTEVSCVPREVVCEARAWRSATAARGPEAMTASREAMRALREVERAVVRDERSEILRAGGRKAGVG